MGYVIERKYKLQDDFWKVGGMRLKCPRGEVEVSSVCMTFQLGFKKKEEKKYLIPSIEYF